MRSWPARIALSLLPALIIAPPASGTTLTMSLDGIAVQSCDETWTEGSCVLRMTETVSGDYTPPGNCEFTVLPDGIELLGARLEIDVSALDGIDWLEVDLLELGGNGRTRVFAFVEGTDTVINFLQSFWNGGATDQTIMMDLASSGVGRIVISGDDSRIMEVRLEGPNLVGLPRSSWSAIKTRW